MNAPLLQKVQRTLSRIKSRREFGKQMNLVAELVDELNDFDSSDDVLPDDREGFLNARNKLAAFAKGGQNTGPAYEEIGRLRDIVDRALAAPIPPALTRFPTVKHAAFRTLLDRDLHEAERLHEQGFHKSSSVMAGSVLEAVIYEYLLRNPTWTMDPARAAIAKKKKKPGAGKVPKPINSNTLEDQWVLKELINFACANNLVKSYNADAIHNVLRDPRNMIHPMKEIRLGQSIDQNKSGTSLNMVKAIIAEFAVLPDPT